MTMFTLGALPLAALATCSHPEWPCAKCLERTRYTIHALRASGVIRPAQFCHSYQLAKEAHGGQVDKAGEPYALHLKRVYNAIEDFTDDRGLWGHSGEWVKDVMSAAWLHDVVEDTAVTLDDLLVFGFSGAVIDMVSILTKSPDDARPYVERIEGIIASGNLGAILIKIADTQDNADPRRLALLPPDKRGISERYRAANARLREAAATHGWSLPPAPYDELDAAESTA